MHAWLPAVSSSASSLLMALRDAGNADTPPLLPASIVAMPMVAPSTVVPGRRGVLRAVRRMITPLAGYAEVTLEEWPEVELLEVQFLTNAPVRGRSIHVGLCEADSGEPVLKYSPHTGCVLTCRPYAVARCCAV